MSADPSHPAPLRRDARLNRERIVEVAHELFARRGLDVPMAAVARHAGVGMATLYRRFPTKEALVGEVFSHQFDLCVAVVDDALDDPDPWRGFVTVVEKVGEMQACDRGFSAAVSSAFPKVADTAAERGRALGRVAALVDRAKAAGKLRADFALTDLMLVLMANDGVTADAPAATRVASQRLVAYLVNSFRAENAGVPLPPAVPLSVIKV
ncbi:MULTISPECIES: TetR/AcrR family transcriptional regulator [unclassified Amycolatopsis]|uniref:TetR/AcrR family transcriptional regulator n=1 Tax=unclassified Amycolatopsis TaxID=2618356 RepID=UPI002E212F4F|nr:MULTISPECIES: helix-turn-helix domain-containing protein [unclassified Amycolatopsis]